MVVVQQPVGLTAAVGQYGRGRRPAVRIDLPPSLLLVGGVDQVGGRWYPLLRWLLVVGSLQILLLGGGGDLRHRRSTRGLHRHPSGGGSPGNGGITSDVHDSVAILGPHLILAKLQLRRGPLDVMGGDGDGRRGGGSVQSRFQGCWWWLRDVGVGRSVGGDVGGVAEVGHQVGLMGVGIVVGIACSPSLCRRWTGMDLGVPHHLLSHRLWPVDLGRISTRCSPSPEFLLLLVASSCRPSMARGRQPPDRAVVPPQHAGFAGHGVPNDRGVGIICTTTALMLVWIVMIGAALIPHQETRELGKEVTPARLPPMRIAGTPDDGRLGR